VDDVLGRRLLERLEVMEKCLLDEVAATGGYASLPI
jgi:hypothetical protein